MVAGATVTSGSGLICTDLRQVEMWRMTMSSLATLSICDHVRLVSEVESLELSGGRPRR